MGFTCNDCRWKIERNDCPWDYDYDEMHDYAEDCIDFRYVKFPETAFDFHYVKFPETAFKQEDK